MAPVVASIFEPERSWSFAGQASGSAGRVAPSADPSVFLARYHLLSKTLGGSLAGALGGVVMVIVVCNYAVEEADAESARFLDFGGCYNRDRWFGFVATGSFIGSAIGGALIATWGCIAEPRLGPIGSPPIP